MATKSFPSNLETIRLSLVKPNAPSQIQEASDLLSQDDAVRYLIRAFGYADGTFVQDVENTLVQLGEHIVPLLLEGVLAEEKAVRSACAMVLIRIGQPTVPSLKRFYQAHALESKVNWVIAFILEQLGESLPQPLFIGLEEELTEVAKIPPFAALSVVS